MRIIIEEKIVIWKKTTYVTEDVEECIASGMDEKFCEILDTVYECNGEEFLTPFENWWLMTLLF